VEKPNRRSINPLQFVDCQRISPNHAEMFFDRTNMRWSIINSSRYGMKVDGVYHSMKSAKSPPEETNYDLAYMKRKINQLRGIKEEFLADPEIHDDVRQQQVS
jgi:hypothetical protein